MSLSLDSIIKVNIDTNISVVSNRDFSLILVLTDENQEIFEDENYKIVSDITEVSEYFAEDTETYKACEAIFSEKAIKKLMLGKRASVKEHIEAKPASLEGGFLTASLEDIKASKASFKISINGEEQEIKNLDLSEAESLEDIAELLNQAIINATCTYNKEKNNFIIKTDIKGAEADLYYLEDLEDEDEDEDGEAFKEIIKFEEAQSYMGCCKVGDFLYASPYNQDSILEINLEDNTYKQYANELLAPKSKFYSICENQGKLYMAPFNHTAIGVFDLESKEYSEIGTLGNQAGKYTHCLAKDDFVYFLPYASTEILVLNVKDNTTTTIKGEGSLKGYSALALGKDNKIYSAPATAKSLMRFDLENNEVETFGSEELEENGKRKFAGILALEENIIYIPDSATYFLIYNTDTDEFKRVEIGEGDGKFMSAFALDKERILILPDEAPYGLTLNLKTKELTKIDFEGRENLFSFVENKGKLIFAPYNKDYVLEAKITNLKELGAKADILKSSDNKISFSSLLSLSEDTAILKEGEDEKVVEEKASVKTSLNTIYNENQNFYGIYPTWRMDDEELEEFHDWFAGHSKRFVGAYTAIEDKDYSLKDDNIFKKLADKNSKRFFVTYNNTGHKHAGAEFLGKALVMDWTSSNSFGTLKFRSLMLTPSDSKIKVDVAEKLRKLGINFYTDYDGTSFTAEGTMLGQGWADETLGLDAFADAVQKELAIVIINNNIKQTDKSHRTLIDAARRVCEQFRKNGFFEAGVWRGKNLGNLETNTYLDDGYYIYSDSYDTQLQSDREARKAVPILVAVKFAGAVHSASVDASYNQ